MRIGRLEERREGIKEEERRGDRVRVGKKQITLLNQNKRRLVSQWRCYCHIIIKRRSLGLFLDSDGEGDSEERRREQRLAYINFG